MSDVALLDVSVFIYIPVCFIILFIYLFQIEAASVLHIPPQSYDDIFIVSFPFILTLLTVILR